MAEIIRTENLRYAYPVEEGETPVYALKGVDLGIARGSFVVVLGHNGSGKSTLAKMLNAVLVPTEGSVLVEGMNTADERLLLAIRQRVGIVFQNPDNQIVANVVEEDVAFAPENLGVPPEEIRRRVDEALKAVGMSEFTTHAPHLLSADRNSASPSRRLAMDRSASCWMRPPPCWTPWGGGRFWPPSTGSTGRRA